MTTEVPEGIYGPGADLYRELMEEFDFPTHELRLLHRYCRTWCLINDIETELAGQPLTIETRAHGQVANRLLTELVSQQKLFMALGKALGIDQAAPDEPPLTPAQRGRLGGYTKAANRQRGA